MRTEIESIIKNLERVLYKEPWYGKAVFTLLEEIDNSYAFEKANPQTHSPIELLYHMLTWAEFTLNRMQQSREKDLEYFEGRDWIKVDAQSHSWEKGVAQLKAVHQEIIEVLKKKDDEWLTEKVEGREYNFRYLLNGLIQHNIYHVGQIAYAKKALKPEA
jgi:uncharacterized damage-inducible protein DinB